MTAQGFDGRPVPREPSWSLWVSNVFILSLVVDLAVALIFHNPMAGAFGATLGLPPGPVGNIAAGAIGIAQLTILFGVPFYCGLFRFSQHMVVRSMFKAMVLIAGGWLLESLALGGLWIVWRAVT